MDTHPECSVCLQLCLQPVQIPCLHVFCFLCLKGFAYRSKKCALCRSDVELKYFENPVVVSCVNIIVDTYNTSIILMTAHFTLSLFMPRDKDGTYCNLGPVGKQTRFSVFFCESLRDITNYNASSQT